MEPLNQIKMWFGFETRVNFILQSRFQMLGSIDLRFVITKEPPVSSIRCVRSLDRSSSAWPLFQGSLGMSFQLLNLLVVN